MICGLGQGAAAGLPSASTFPQVSSPFGRVDQRLSDGRWRRVHGGEQLCEVTSPGTAFGQVEGEAAGRAGQAGGHVDEVIADRGGGGSGVDGAGQGASHFRDRRSQGTSSFPEELSTSIKPVDPG